MAPRDPLRAKASDISDVDMLEFCRIAVEHNGVSPMDAPALDGYTLPAKVVHAKLAKLIKRGWIDPRHRLTKQGYVALAELSKGAA